jgi:dTDP-4-dehydrorhamnose 3,5-epimerase-like enzyme
VEIPQGAKLIELPKIGDDRGNLSFFESEKHVPFKIARTYWVYDVPGGGTRGGHAFQHTHEMIVSLSGSFDVVVHDGKSSARFLLNRSYVGLVIPAKTWRNLENFSTNAVALVVASRIYDEDDYVRDFEIFVQSKGL